MILHMRHTLWTGISEKNVNIITSATRPHAFNNKNIDKKILLTDKLNIVSVNIRVGWGMEMVVFKRNANILRFLHLHMIAGYLFYVSPNTLRHVTALKVSIVK